MSRGFRNVKVLQGGVEAWTKAGYPIGPRASGASLFERILVPLDGSDASEAVLYQAERLLCGRKCEVILFHAWRAESDDFATVEAAEDYLKSVQEHLSAGGAQTLRRLVRRGTVSETLAATVESEKVSLIAMSSHGRETEPRAPVAGTVEELLKGIRVPILVARAFRPSGSQEPLPAECEAPTIRRILLPHDGSKACEAIIPFARELAQLLGALIVLLNVRPGASRPPGGGPESGAPGPFPESVPEDDAPTAARIEAAAKIFASGGLETMTLTMGGDPASTILDFARPSAVDLIAMTNHGQGGPSGLSIGRVAEKVFRSAILPTLLVRSEPEPAVLEPAS